ncbi:hypothetical protein [Chromobacterium violaceum]|nr:hypothetical protein [Chromobacterium violaceum]
MPLESLIAAVFIVAFFGFLSWYGTRPDDKDKHHRKRHKPK